MSLNQLTILQAHQGLIKKQFSAIELTKACLEQIKKVDAQIKSFVTVTEEVALKQADEIDKKIKNGEKISPIAGIPSAIKDVIVTKDILSTASSNILKNYIPPFDATVVKILKEKGLVILGKTNCDAFAHGASTENSDFFPTHNPWDIERVPGGSSGGSASAVAADQSIYTLGTDTGGSIRQPAAFCGIVGLKPTYGRVSRYGLMSMTSSTDCVSIMAKCVADAAIVLSEIAGKDENDSTTVDVKVDDFFEALQRADPKSLKGLRIGVPNEYFVSGMNPGVERAVREAILKLEKLGAEISGVSLPHTKYAVSCYYIITPSEISANLARYDGIKYGYSVINDSKHKDEAQSLFEVYTKSRRYGFGAEAKRRIMLGTFALSAGYYDAYYLKAQKVRTLIRKDFDEVFKKFDCLVTPTSPNVAFKIGEHTKDPLEMYLEDIFVSAVSLAGLPAISIPCGFARAKDSVKELPVGLQLIGKPFDEATVLKVAYAYEQNTEWHKAKPKGLSAK